MVHGQHGFLYRKGTANRGAVGLGPALLASGAGALQKGDFLGNGLVGKALQMAAEGSGGAQHALELKAGDYVRIGLVAKGVQFFGIITFGTHGEDDGPHLLGEFPALVVKINGSGGADFFAGPTLALGQVDAVFAVDEIL